MLDCLFLSPPRRADGSMYLFNNATLQLASYLTQQGLAVRLEPLFGPSWRDRLEWALSHWKPRWVAISCKWWDTVYGAVEVARHIREHHPHIKLVTGGQTATSFAESLVAKTPFDAVITGDAEYPLTQLVKGEPDCNVVLREGGRLPQKYVQGRGPAEKLELVADLLEIAPSDLLYQAGFTAPFIWTGKGCQSACSYCSGSAFGHKKLFARTGFAYRPMQSTLNDIQALSPWTRKALMFDFDPVADPAREEYYFELARELRGQGYHAAFYCWTLPTHEFIARMSESFASIIVSLDAQTYSEPLRQKLSSRNQLKPFASDLQLLQTLEFMRQFPNVHGVVYGILGLQGETAYDVARGESLMAYIADAYADVLQPNGVHTTPLAIEPDSLIDRNPEKFGITRLRHGLDDYLAYTKIRFESKDEQFHSQFDPELPHPYGLHQSHEAADRVYHDFRRITERIEAKSHAWAAETAMQSLHIDAERVALTLRNRSIFQDDWRLILWAAQQALQQGLPRLEVDTRQAHLRVPPAEIFPFDEQFFWAGEQWQAVQEAQRQGRLTLHFECGPTTDLGFLAAALTS
jgi:hypothetical protein